MRVLIVEDEVKLAVLAGSITAALLGALVLILRGARYRRRAAP